MSLLRSKSTQQKEVRHSRAAQGSYKVTRKAVLCLDMLRLASWPLAPDGLRYASSNNIPWTAEGCLSPHQGCAVRGSELMLLSAACAFTLQRRAYVMQPRSGLPSMSVDPSFWQAKQARARYTMEKKSSLLDELMEREQILIDQLLMAQQGVEAVPVAADPSLQLELDKALAALEASEQRREIGR